jgi:hypothetical protein
MDKYTTELITKVLDRVNGSLGHLVSFVSEKREKEKQSMGPNCKPTEEEYAALGRVFIATYGHSPESRTEKPKKKWYRKSKWWKDSLKVAGILSAIAYAIVTYLQWKDLQHNFFIE